MSFLAGKTVDHLDWHAKAITLNQGSSYFDTKTKLYLCFAPVVTGVDVDADYDR